MKSSEETVSNKLEDKYNSLSQDFGKSVFIDEAEEIMDQLEEMLTETKSNLVNLLLLKQSKVHTGCIFV